MTEENDMKVFDPETHDLYSWASRMAVEIVNEHTFDEEMTSERRIAWWSAREAARKIAMILYTFIGMRKGQEITSEMLEEMRQLCARVAYD